MRVDHKHPAAVKITRRRRLLIALILIMVGLLVVVALLAWPEPPPKNLTLRLSIVRSGFEDGEPAVLLRIEGAEQYEVRMKSLNYLLGDKSATSVVDFVPTTRGFWVTAPYQYFADLGNQGWKVQVDVCVLAPEKKNIVKAFRAIRFAWRVNRYPRVQSIPPTFFSATKAYWQMSSKYVVTDQTITSDVITNTLPH